MCFPVNLRCVYGEPISNGANPGTGWEERGQETGNLEGIGRGDGDAAIRSTRLFNVSNILLSKKVNQITSVVTSHSTNL